MHTHSLNQPVVQRYVPLLLLIVAVGVLLRIAALVAVAGPDGVRYGFHYLWAQTIAETGEFVMHGYPFPGFEWRAQRPPGYPVFLAMLIKVFGDFPAILVAAQAVLAAAFMAASAALARQWFGDRAGLLAAIGVAIYPYYVVNDLVLHDRLAFNLMMVLGAILATRITANTSLVRIAGLGVLLGVATLVRGSAIGIAAFYTLWLFWSAHGPHRWQRGFLRASSFAVAFVLAISPWLVRNAVVVGVPTLGTGAGYQYWVGNNPWMIPQGYPAASAESGVAYWIASQPEATRAQVVSLSEAEVNRYFFGLVVDFVSHQPMQALTNLALKAYAFWSPQFSPEYFCEFPRDHETADGKVDSLPTSICPVAKPNPHYALKNLVQWLSYAPVLLLALWGWARWRTLPGISYVVSAFTGLFVLHVLTVVESIYRSPLDVFLIVLATGVLTQWGRGQAETTRLQSLANAGDDKR